METSNCTCINCGGDIEASEQKSGRKWVQCAYCGTIFRITKDEDDQLSENDILLPENITIERIGNDLRIVRRWFSSTKLLNLALVAMEAAIVTLWSMNYYQWGIATMILFEIPSLIVTVVLVYSVFADLINKTTILVSEQLRIKHNPLPWLGNRQLKSEHISHVYCKQKDIFWITGYKTAYEIRVHSKNGKNIRLLSNINMPEQALFIAQVIDKHLAINK